MNKKTIEGIIKKVVEGWDEKFMYVIEENKDFIELRFDGTLYEMLHGEMYIDEYEMKQLAKEFGFKYEPINQDPWKYRTIFDNEVERLGLSHEWYDSSSIYFYKGA